MGSARDIIVFVFLAFVVLGFVSDCNAAGLSKNFYERSCRKAEKLVRDITWGKAKSDPSLGAKLIRLHYHDCFVKGCDASILLDTIGSNQSEKDARPNLSLLGFEVIDDIKTQVEKLCPNTVSCADILALAARDSVSFPFKRNMWEVLTGRRDGRTSLISDVTGNLPSPFSDFKTLVQIFSNKDLSVTDLVVLSGAHTIGRAHCGAFSRRLYNFTGQGDTDPSLAPTYAETLKKQCPNPASALITVEMDPKSSLTFDNHYFQAVNQSQGLFQSDAALLTDQNAKNIVRRFLSSNRFFFEFGKSMKKMGDIQVLTGTAGEIRKNCRLAN